MLPMDLRMRVVSSTEYVISTFEVRYFPPHFGAKFLYVSYATSYS